VGRLPAKRSPLLSIIRKPLAPLKPGIQNLVGFAPSAGVTITSGPTLTIGTGDVWEYTFTVNMTTPTGDVHFTGNLSAGSQTSVVLR
jgi:hypothetical protein